VTNKSGKPRTPGLSKQLQGCDHGSLRRLPLIQRSQQPPESCPDCRRSLGDVFLDWCASLADPVSIPDEWRRLTDKVADANSLRHGLALLVLRRSEMGPARSKGPRVSAFGRIAARLARSLWRAHAELTSPRNDGLAEVLWSDAGEGDTPEYVAWLDTLQRIAIAFRAKAESPKRPRHRPLDRVTARLAEEVVKALRQAGMQTGGPRAARVLELVHFAAFGLTISQENAKRRVLQARESLGLSSKRPQVR
jgi:hypothetical protein